MSAPTEIGPAPGAPVAPATPPRVRRPVVDFLVRRIALGVLTLVASSILIFLATNALPGNVAQVVLGRDATPERLAALESSLGLDRPLVERYVSWLVGALHGDLGRSAVAMAQSAPETSVSVLIAGPLLNSSVLALIAAVLLIPLSLAVGVFAAVRAGRPSDHVLSYVTLAFGALPEFVLGTLLIVVFSSWLGLLPPVSLLGPSETPLSHPVGLVLPVLTLLGVAVAFSSRQVRAGMIRALRSEHVKTARLNGLAERRIRYRYGLRTSLATSVQSFAQSIQYLFGGIIVVEALFTYPGIGTALINAVLRRDVTQVQGIALLLAAAYIVINILADLVVLLVVPKLRTGAR